MQLEGCGRRTANAGGGARLELRLRQAASTRGQVMRQAVAVPVPQRLALSAPPPALLSSSRCACSLISLLQLLSSFVRTLCDSVLCLIPFFLSLACVCAPRLTSLPYAPLNQRHTLQKQKTKTIAGGATTPLDLALLKLNGTSKLGRGRRRDRGCASLLRGREHQAAAGGGERRSRSSSGRGGS